MQSTGMMDWNSGLPDIMRHGWHLPDSITSSGHSCRLFLTRKSPFIDRGWSDRVYFGAMLEFLPIVHQQLRIIADSHTHITRFNNN